MPLSGRPLRSLAPAALLVVACGLLASGCGGQDGDGASRSAPPAPPTSRPTGEAPASADTGVGTGPTDLAWWAAGTLHAGGSTYRMPRRPSTLAWRSGTTLVTTSAHGSRPYRMLVTRAGGPLRRVGPGGHPVDAVLSADGLLVGAVVTIRSVGHGPEGADFSRTTTRTIEYAVRSGRARLAQVHTENVYCCDATGLPIPVAVTRRLGVGVRIYRERPLLLFWKPGATPLRFRGVRPSDGDWPSGVALQGARGEEVLARVRAGHLVRTGRSGRFGRFGHAEDGVWNPTGALWASESSGGHVDVERRTGGRPRPLPVLGPILAWEGPSTLLVGSTGPRRGVRRCDTRSLTCAPVPGIPHGGGVLLPEAVPAF